MHLKSMLRGALLASVFAPILAFSGVMAAGSDAGTQNCSGSRTVYIYSQSSVKIDVYWTGSHHVQYTTAYQEYRANSTTYHSTWWAVDYDYQRISNGAACEQ